MAHFLGKITCWVTTVWVNPRKIRTSIENMTPPIGEPKATVTPAADAAVKFTRILPCPSDPGSTYIPAKSEKRRTYLDFERID